jgi:hypothetical protein
LHSVFDETTNHSLAKNLIQFEFTFDSQFTNDMFNTFMANNKSLKNLVIRGIDTHIESQETVIGFMNRLSQLQELRELKLNFIDSHPIEYSLSELLVEIGLKCDKLKSFCLRMKTQTPQMNVDILNAIQFMPQLKRLDLWLGIPNGFHVTTDYHLFDSMKCWPKLTHLTLLLWQINYRLFREIATNQPNLQLLEICDLMGDINAISLDRIKGLPKLQSLVIIGNSGLRLNESDLKAFVLKSCPKLQFTRIRNHKDNIQYDYNDKQIYEMRNLLPLCD